MIRIKHLLPTQVYAAKMASSQPRDQQQSATNYKEAFSLFDKRGTGRVALECLGDLLRACGQNPTLAEIKELEKQVGGDCTFLSFLPSLLPTLFGFGDEMGFWTRWMDSRVLTRCGPVDFEAFQKVLNRPGGFREPGEPEEYCRGFQVFDKDLTGFIGVGQLRYSMFPGRTFTVMEETDGGMAALDGC